MPALSDKTKEAMIRLFRDLVAFDTTSCNSNIPAADHLADYLVGRGCSIERFPADNGQKVNLVARKGPYCEGGLILSGHLDVVPAAEPDWKSDPFELIETDDRYTARGAADMKGFVSIAAGIMAAVDADKMCVPLVGIFTCNEEIGTVGAQEFVRDWDNRWPMPTSAIIGEPTNLKVVRMHKGHTRLSIHVHGKSGHSGYPKLGSNAVEKLGMVIQAIIDLRKEIESERTEYSRFFAETPHAVLNPAIVAGGKAINIIPDYCSLDLGLRVLPGESSRTYIDRINRRLAELKLAENELTLTVNADSPPLLTDADSEINRRLCGHIGQTEELAVHYASDAGPFAQLGIQSVLYGPGSIEVAHKPNEYLLKSQYNKACDVLSEFVTDWCMKADCC